MKKIIDLIKSIPLRYKLLIVFWILFLSYNTYLMTNILIQNEASLTFITFCEGVIAPVWCGPVLIFIVYSALLYLFYVLFDRKQLVSFMVYKVVQYICDFAFFNLVLMYFWFLYYLVEIRYGG